MLHDLILSGYSLSIHRVLGELRNIVKNLPVWVSKLIVFLEFGLLLDSCNGSGFGVLEHWESAEFLPSLLIVKVVRHGPPC